MNNIKVGIIGAGYVGITTAVTFADRGFSVFIYDKNEKIIAQLYKGISHFYEPGLDKLLNNYVINNTIQSFNSIDEIIKRCDVVFICVGTPSNKDGSVNLTYIKSVTKDIAKSIKYIKHHITIVVKSTVIPETTDTLILGILESESSLKLGEFGLGMNPEFLREGSALDDALHPDRIVIGSEDVKTKNILIQLYESWDCEKILVNTRTAEFIKYVNNSFLAIQISASNEFANLARSIGKINYNDVFKGLIEDRRWNIKNSNLKYPGIISYLKPGPGFGGSCFPKDVKAIADYGKSYNQKMRILNAVNDVNENQHLEIEKILSIHNKLGLDKSILMLGLSFKENTDDIRESKSIALIKQIYNKVNLYLHDPNAIKNTNRNLGDLPNIYFTDNWVEKTQEVDAVVLMVNWDEYKSINYNLIKSISLFIDARGIFIDNRLSSLKNYKSLYGESTNYD